MFINPMRIFPKLLIVLILTSSILLLLLYALIQFGVDRGMLNYVNQRQMQSLQLISHNLSNIYQEHGDWQKVVASSTPPHERKRISRAHKRDNFGIEYWRNIVRLSEQGLTYPEDLEQLKQGESRKKGPPQDGKRRDRRFKDNTDDFRARDISANPARNNRQKPSNEFERPGDRDMPSRPRYSLLDKNKELLIGRYNKRFVEKAIIVNDSIVGYVALPPTEQITNKFDLQFMHEINQYLIVVLVGVFAIIIAITVPLSRHFVRPIAKLKQAVIKVNSGELATRLPIIGSDELATLGRNFNDLAATLEQNEVSRKRWLADIAHELRTPLAIVKGEIEAMEDGIRPLSIENISSIADEVSHLQRLINDLNELNQAEIGAMRYQKSVVDINQLIRLNSERHRELLQSQGLELTVNLPKQKINCWADPTRLNQLLDNLFSNSAKYTDAPGQVRLRLKKEKDLLYINIEDSQPGVREDELGKLFEHLYRVESSRNRTTGGSGIGLALCKNIVYAHQGEISAHATNLGGLMIEIKLPTC